MALTTYVNLAPELETQYFTGIQPGDRFNFARMSRKNLLLSRKSKKGISQRSLLPEIGIAWAGLTSGEKDAWTAAGAECNLNGWRLFVQDYCARKVNELPGVATPDLLHQSWVGQLHIENPATELKLIQIHPHFYYVKRKITGTKSMYSPVLVTEDLTLPFVLGLNYKSNLSAAGADPYAKVYAKFWYSYQGVNLYHELTINLDLVHDWQAVEATLTALETIVIRYDLYIHLHDLQGDLFFDNIRAEHTAVNWARDPFCKDINQGFTVNFYQIPKHWAAVIAPVGAVYESIYQDF